MIGSVLWNSLPWELTRNGVGCCFAYSVTDTYINFETELRENVKSVF
jgi:hypothetical protein